MKAYGDEWKRYDDTLNSTKTGASPGNNKTIARRLAKKRRRARDKATLHHAVHD